MKELTLKTALSSSSQNESEQFHMIESVSSSFSSIEASFSSLSTECKHHMPNTIEQNQFANIINNSKYKKTIKPNEVAILWDYDSAPLPPDASSQVATRTISDLAMKFGTIVERKLYVRAELVKEALCAAQEFDLVPVSCSSCSSSLSEKMAVDGLTFGWDTSIRGGKSCIIFITNNIGLVYSFRKLRDRGCIVASISSTKGNMSIASTMKSASNFTFGFESVTSPRSSKKYKFPPRAPPTLSYSSSSSGFELDSQNSAFKLVPGIECRDEMNTTEYEHRKVDDREMICCCVYVLEKLRLKKKGLKGTAWANERKVKTAFFAMTKDTSEDRYLRARNAAIEEKLLELAVKETATRSKKNELVIFHIHSDPSSNTDYMITSLFLTDKGRYLIEVVE